jgi:hypothetical protein
LRSARGHKRQQIPRAWADAAVGCDTSVACTEDCNSSATSVVLCVKKWTDVDDGFNSLIKVVCC